MLWRDNFIATYLKRDIPQLGPRIPAETLRRFWTMLADSQGTLWNASPIARALAVDGKTATSYLDLMVDLLLVRRLPPFHANVRKCLVKSPKVYVRDSGIAFKDVDPDRAIVLPRHEERIPKGGGVEAMSLRMLAEELAALHP